MNYINFRYLKPTLVQRVEEPTKHDIVYIQIHDSHPYEPMNYEEFVIEGNTIYVPWVLLGADFIANVN